MILTRSSTKRSFSERLEAYPSLKEHIEQMLNVVENIERRANKANDAVVIVINNMRKIGAPLCKNGLCREKKQPLQSGPNRIHICQTRKKVRWEITVGQREIVVQHFLYKQKPIIPFSQKKLRGS